MKKGSAVRTVLACLAVLALGACAEIYPFTASAPAPASAAASGRPTVAYGIRPEASSAPSAPASTCNTDCDGEKDKTVVYVDRPVEEATRVARSVRQVDACPACVFPVSVRGRGSEVSN